MPVGLHSGRVWRNSIFSLFPSLVDIYAELLLSLLRSDGGIRAFALPFFSMTDGVLKRILKCAGLSRMPLGLTFSRRVSLQTRISQCGYLVRGSIGWDSARGAIEIVDRRVVKITNTIDSIIASDFVLSARRLASFTEQIVSGNISRIMTRHCIMYTLSVQHWDSEVKMDSYCVEELYFWKNNLHSIKVRDCFLFTAVISHTRPPTIFSISKTTFWWTSIKCIHDNSRVHFVVSVSRPCSIIVGSWIIAQLLWQSNLQFRWDGGLLCRENVACLWIA